MKLILFIITILLLANTSLHADENKDVLLENKKNIQKFLKTHPIFKRDQYKFDPKSKLIDRVKKAPPALIESTSKLDKKKYKAYDFKKGELEIIKKSLEEIPDFVAEVLHQKLLGIYFIDDLHGSGWSHWVIDDKFNDYHILMFNPKVLQMGLSEWLTWKENTCYINDDKDISLTINCGKKYKAFIGIFLHEAAHVYDAHKNVVPYMDGYDYYFAKFRGDKIEGTSFTSFIWESELKPHKEFQNSIFKNIKHYAKDKSTTPISSTPKIYRALEKSAFTSIYSMKSWSEDFAEFLMFSVITLNLDQPYEINIKRKDKVILQVKPMENPIIQARLDVLEDSIIK